MTRPDKELPAPLLPAGDPVEKLLRQAQFFTPGTPTPDYRGGGRRAEEFYRERWRHDEEVRSAHGVTGRVRYPYVRGELLKLWREARKTRDPVDAWKNITEDPDKRDAYIKARGKGGLVRSTWDEASELIAAAHVRTTKAYGPDRIAGFPPIPATSMVSYSAGTRFLSLIGATILSFYDWNADTPIASPQVFGDQTDVPESGDWRNSSYLLVWGTNLPAAPGTDGALAMAMGHVILTEFFQNRTVPYFQDYVKTYTDAPFLVTLAERDGGGYVPGRFLTQEGEPHRPVLLDQATGKPVTPNGTLGDRFSQAGLGKWNLDLNGIDPVLTLHGRHSESVAIDLPRFDVGPTEGGSSVRRGVPAIRVDGQLVTTVFDLLMAQYSVARDGLPGDWSDGYGTPAWQEEITGVPAAAAARVAREFARNAEQTGGRSMIAMGAGTSHRHHSDQVYRTFFTLIMLCGCQGVNGGGWAHYPGQEKVWPLAGFQQVGFGLDWTRPPRHMAATSFFYLHTDQWRHETSGPGELASPLGTGRFAGRSLADCVSTAARLGWSPSHPGFNRNPLNLTQEAKRIGLSPPDYAVRELRAGRLKFAADDPDDPVNWPRVMTVWRANPLGSSGKGLEYFMRHLIGADDAVRAEESPDVTRRDEAPRGKLDLLTAIDFRMTSTCAYADVVLPAATWYEKHDLSSTDTHPFIRSFNPAIAPPWETRTDFDAFASIARDFSRLAETHLGTRTDLVAVPLTHDTPDELAQPGGVVRDWAAGECEPVPGVTMPKLVTVERDYPAVAAKMAALGPLPEKLGTAVKGVNWKPAAAVDYLRRANGTIRGGVTDGQPSLATGAHLAEAILALSGTTNGKVALQGWWELEKRTGVRLSDLAAERAGDHITFADTQAQPRAVITSPEWSGSESGGRRYSPFAVNVERKKPWHTLTGRMHFFLDHDWIHELGEALPAYRPPLDYRRHVIKPSHLIGGYAQFSYAFNYCGPTGNQRDEPARREL